MNDSSLIRIHRVKTDASAVFLNTGSLLFCKLSESVLSLFSVIAGVDGNSLVIFLILVDNKSCKILDSVECFASSADYIAVTAAAVKVDSDAVFNFIYVDFNVFNLRLLPKLSSNSELKSVFLLTRVLLHKSSSHHFHHN